MERIGLTPGSEVGGYTIVAPLGSGGMGTVYRAVDGGGTRVALKMLHPHVGSDAVVRARLMREVAALQRLRHPAVAAVLDAEADSTEAFLVTELVAGDTLTEHVREHGPLGPRDLLTLAEGLRSALAAVHAAGVVHRDLKPSNVLVTDGGPVLIDFGLAQGVDDDADLTSAGFVLGTPGYLAPELLDGGEAGPATDLWGWAALLAFAATGRDPFGSRPVEAVLARARSGEVDLEGVGPLTAAAIAGALRPEPADRTAPDDVVAALRTVVAEGDLPAGAAAAVVPAGGHGAFGGAAVAAAVAGATGVAVAGTGTDADDAADDGADTEDADGTDAADDDAADDVDAGDVAPDADDDLADEDLDDDDLDDDDLDDDDLADLDDDHDLEADGGTVDADDDLDDDDLDDDDLDDDPDDEERWEEDDLATELVAQRPSPQDTLRTVAVANAGGAAATTTVPPATTPLVAPAEAPVRDGHTVAVPVRRPASVPPPRGDDEPDGHDLEDEGDDGVQDPDGVGWLEDDLDRSEGPEGEGSGYARPPARRRWGSLLALGLVVALAGTRAPLLTLAVVLVLVVVVRTVGTAVEAMHTRRERRGVRRSDVPVALMGTPWYLLRAVLGVLPAVLVGGAVVVIVAGIGWWLLGSGRWEIGGSPPGAEPQGHTAMLVVGALVVLAVVLLWWGPLSRMTRTGARRTLAVVAPGPVGALVVVVLALVGALLLADGVLDVRPISWWPVDAPRLPAG
ncbi:serine/threonine-protein kinase [Cellulomonas sp. KH9]|uniref:serine/threonine-protein kinase n=1 Tax=Cellulomonas sp. KH9 TaxID=1855324 RepID=UPI0008ECF582|nr:serine/threonine-protein kinase [Cellulomonas sp. KH9]SFK17129.1 Protein kinase domain-containing protein [Cellulomonas sp. KH9]